MEKISLVYSNDCKYESEFLDTYLLCFKYYVQLEKKFVIGFTEMIFCSKLKFADGE